MSKIVIVVLIYRRHKPIDRINLFGLYWRRDVFPVRYEHDPSCVLNKRQGYG
jgi:hypothetical protein